MATSCQPQVSEYLFNLSYKYLSCHTRWKNAEGSLQEHASTANIIDVTKSWS